MSRSDSTQRNQVFWHLGFPLRLVLGVILIILWLAIEFFFLKGWLRVYQKIWKSIEKGGL